MTAISCLFGFSVAVVAFVAVVVCGIGSETNRMADKRVLTLNSITH